MNIEHFHNQTFNGLVTYMNEIGHSGQANGTLKMEKRHFSAAKYLILGLISLAAAENKYVDDMGIVVTAKIDPDKTDGRQIVAIPTTPREVPNYPGRSFPGYTFDDPDVNFISCDFDYDRNQIYLYDKSYRRLVVGSNFNTSLTKDIVWTEEQNSMSPDDVKVAVDWISHNVYWTDPSMGAIMIQPGGQNVSQTKYRRLVHHDIDYPVGIAVDPVAGFLFWTDLARQTRASKSLSSRIERSSLTGEDRRLIIATGLANCDAIVADHASLRIFFTDTISVTSATYDGRDIRRIAIDPQTRFFDIAVFQDVLIATDQEDHYMRFYDVTGINTEVVNKEHSLTELFQAVCMYSNITQPIEGEDLCATSGCQDICVRQPYKDTETIKCLCREGFSLNADNKTCIETVGLYHRAILLNNGTHLCLLPVTIMSDHQDHKVDCFYSITHTNETITHVDVNMRLREVYFATENAIYRVPISFDNAQEQKVISLQRGQDGKGRVTGLSYDWINHHIYWSEQEPDGLFLVNPDMPATEFLQLVGEEDLATPRGILVLPHERKIFWLSGNVTRSWNSSIRSADLGASTPIERIPPTDVPVSYYIESLTHMYYDTKENRILVLDMPWSEIIMLNHEGQYKRSIYMSGIKDFAVYQDYVLAMSHDDENGTHLTASNIKETPPKTVTKGEVDSIGVVISIKVIDADVLQPTYPSPCREIEDSRGGCDQICTPRGETAMCHCDVGFTMNADGKTCDTIMVDDNFFVFTDDFHQKTYQIGFAQPEVMSGISLQTTQLRGILYNWVTGRLVYADDDEVWDVKLDGTNATLLAKTFSLLGTPIRLAMDPTNGYIYYTGLSWIPSWFPSYIGVITPDGDTTDIPMDDAADMVDLVLHPEMGYVYWTDQGNTQGTMVGVYRASMDGSNKMVIADGDDADVSHPTGLAIDYSREKIYWGDDVLKKIMRCDMDGQNRVVFLENAGKVIDVRVVGEYLYYISSDNSKIFRVKIGDTTDVALFGPSVGIAVPGSLDVHISTETSIVPKNVACGNNNGGCSHICLPNGEGGRTCRCHLFYLLLSDDMTCENVPRCPISVVNGLIDDKCLRRVGDSCSVTCDPRYRLKEENKTVMCTTNTTWDDEIPCEEDRYTNKYGDFGVVMTARPFDITDFQQIVSIPTKPRDIKNFPGRRFNGGRFSDARRKFHACDVDYNLNMLYLYDYQYRTLVVANNFNTSVMIDAMNATNEMYGLAGENVKIAVDWVSHNVYYSDPMMGAIMMQPGRQYLNQNLYLRIIYGGLNIPRGIALDPLSGYLFWTDWSGSSKIERSSLIGENRIPIVKDTLYIPEAITADHKSERIYFSNYHNIETTRYDGRNRIVLTKKSQAWFFDVAIYQDIVLATDTSSSGYVLHSYDANTGEMVNPKEGSPKEAFFGVCVYDEEMQPPSPQPDLCVDAGCEDICVSEPNKIKPTCLCRLGYSLNDDGRTCTEKAGQYHRAELLTDGIRLCLLDLRILSDHHNHKVYCFYEHTVANENINFIDVNMKANEAFFSTNTSIYRVAINNTKTSPAVKLVTAPGDKAQGHITGLSFDWINNHLYWSENDPDGIFYMNPDSPQDFLQVTDDTLLPRAVLVLPHNQTVFWISQNETGTQYHIEYGDLAVRRPIKSIVPTQQTLLNPTRMHHDNKYEVLTLLDVSAILEFSYNGTFKDIYYTGENVKDFALYGDYMLVVEHDSEGNTVLYSADMGYGSPLVPIEQGIIEGIDKVVAMVVIDPDVLQPMYKSPCSKVDGKEGGCDQICIPLGELAECLCDTGFTLNDDNKTCNSSYTLMYDNIFLVADILHNNIYQIPQNNLNILNGIKIPNRASPSGLLYNYMTEKVIWGSKDSSQIWGVSLDGSNATMVGDMSLYFATPSAFALDRTTGNMYVTAISYWASDYKDSIIAVINPTGGINVLYNNAEYPSDIALHPEKGYMYWTDYGHESSKVARMGMDGSNMKILAEGTDALFPTGIAIDFEEGHVYWCDALLHQIVRTNFDGNDLEIFHTETGFFSAMRLSGDYVYFTGMDNMHITRINKRDTTDKVDIGPKVGIGSFDDLDIYSSSQVQNIPVNAICSQQNGNCSHFCLPNGEGGRTCACEGIYSLLIDDQTCENAPRRCGEEILGGTLNADCPRIADHGCGFTCNYGYRKKKGVTEMMCQKGANDELKWNNAAPCEEVFCPNIMSNIQLPVSCSAKVGADCSEYTCGPGYEKNKDVKYLNCTEDGTWSSTPTSLCLERCPVLTAVKDLSDLDNDCGREPNEDCGFNCIKNYKPAINSLTIKCLPGNAQGVARWNVTTATLCEEILCPDYIKNGRVHDNCTRQVDKVCTYKCDDNFEQSDKYTKITCNEQGDWTNTGNDDTLCTAIIIPPAAVTSDKLAIGLGIGLGILALLIIVLVLFILFRKGKLPMKSKSGTSGSAFENPRYEESSFDNPMSRESNKDFSYATLDDKLELTDDSWTKTQARSPEPTYDNNDPATISASAINPRF